MNRKSLSILGRIAAAFRNAGLSSLFTAVRDALDAFFQLIKFPPLAADIDGIRLHGFLRHRSFLEHLAKGTYEPASRKLFREMLASAEVFVDAGAHIGLYSMLAGRWGNPGLVIFSFEPDPYNLLAFQWNMRLNRSRNINLFRAAVSDSTGSARLVVSDGTIGSSLNLERTKIGGTHLLEVKTVALDPVLEGAASKAILIKLDIEGAELRALKGLDYTLRRASRVALFCEVNPEALGAGGKTSTDLINGLRNAGLDVFFLSEAAGGLVPVADSCEAKGNLFAVRDWPVKKDWILA